MSEFDDLMLENDRLSGAPTAPEVSAVPSAAVESFDSLMQENGAIPSGGYGGGTGGGALVIPKGPGAGNVVPPATVPAHVQTGRGVGYGLSNTPRNISALGQAGMNMVDPLGGARNIARSGETLFDWLGIDSQVMRDVQGAIPDIAAPANQYINDANDQIETGAEELFGLPPEPPLEEQPPLQRLTNRATQNLAFAPMGWARGIPVAGNLARAGGEAVGGAIGAEAGAAMTDDSLAGTIVGDLLGAVTGRKVGGKIIDFGRPPPNYMPGIPDTVKGKGVVFDSDIAEKAAVVLQDDLETYKFAPKEVGAELRAGMRADNYYDGMSAGQVTDNPVIQSYDAKMRVDDTLAAKVSDHRVTKAAQADVKALGTGESPLHIGRVLEKDLASDANISQRTVDAAEVAEVAARQSSEAAPVRTIPADTANTRQVMDTTVDAAEQATRKARNELYDAVPYTSGKGNTFVVQVRSDAGGVPQGHTPMTKGGGDTFKIEEAIYELEKADPAVTKTSGWRSTTAQIKEALATEKDGWVSLEEMMKLRKRLTIDAYDAAKSKDKGIKDDLAPALQKLKAAIDGELEFIAKNGNDEAKEAVAALKAAREYHGGVFAPRHKKGMGGAIKKEREYGKDFNPEKTAGKFIHGGTGGKHARDLRAILDEHKRLGANPAKTDAVVRDYMVNDLLEVEAAAGKLTPKAVKTWRTKYKDALDEFPEIKKEVDGLVDDAMARDENLVQKVAALKTSKAAHAAYLKQLKDDPRAALAGKDGYKVAEALLNGDNPAKQLEKLMPMLDRKGKDSLKQAVTDMLERQASTMAGDDLTMRMDTVVKRHRETLRQIYNEKQMETLDRVGNAARGMARRGGTTVRGSGTTPLSKNSKLLNSGVGAVLRLKYGMLKGGGIHRIMKDFVNTFGLEVDVVEFQVSRMLDRAMIDPEMAATLAEMDIKIADPKTWRPMATMIRDMSEVAQETQGVNGDTP